MYNNISRVAPPPSCNYFQGENGKKYEQINKRTFFPRITMAGPLCTLPRTGPSVKHVNCWWRAQLIWRLKTVLDKLRLMLLIPMFSGLWPDLSCPFLSQPVLSSCPILSHDNFLLSCFTKNKNLDSLIFDDWPSLINFVIFTWLIH